MSQFKQEDVKGLVRNSGKEAGYTAVLNDGSKRKIDDSTAKTLMNRLDKDRSRMEREGTRSPEREPEKRGRNPVASREAQLAYLRQFEKKNT